MIKWGITSGSHDGALSVFENANLLFASDAERFSGIKNDKEIPEKMMKYALNKYGEPDQIFFYEDPYLKAQRRHFSKQDETLTVKHPEISKKYKVKYINHHYSHACYGYYTSDFEESLILVIDAIGEWDTLTLWKSDTQNITKLKNWSYPKSLGLMYSACTQSAGWKPNEEEYIMMGASSIFKENKILTEYLRSLWNNNFNFHTGIDLENFDKNDIPASTQILYEEIFQKILKEVIENPNYNGNLIFVGGCALNVKANRFLNKFDSVYIPCNPGDGGSSIGCVLSSTKQKISSTPYLGYEIVGKYPVDDIIYNLVENTIVGVAKGKSEFGPRALGNRSIFGDVRREHLKDELNELKGREFFRPFGVMILKEDVDEWYYDSGIRSPYMNCVFKAKEKTITKYPSAIHIDGTTRLQIVDRETNLRELLEKWKVKTNCPMIVNTSLNIKGKPMVNDEKDLIQFKSLKIL
jgi:carbamoyltransferase